MAAMVDSQGAKIKIGDGGLIRIDGITVFRKIERGGIIYLQFCDNDRMRAKCRGTKFVEIPLDVVYTLLNIKDIPNGSEQPTPPAPAQP